MGETRTIAVANQKGGTGKTTTAVTTGHKLAMSGRRVLLVDTDTQGHLAETLGLQKQPGIQRLVRWYRSDEELLIVEARDNLDLLPSDATTKEAKQDLVGIRYQEFVLAELLDHLRAEYDVIIIDCAPSVDVLHESALLAADWLIVPTQLNYLAVSGVNEVLKLLKAIQTGPVPDVGASLFGVLPTFYDRRLKETEIQLRELHERFGQLVMPPIPVDARMERAPAFGQTIWEYAPDARSVMGVETRDHRRYGGYERFVELIEERL